jgi:hypothetical protein
MNSMSEYVLDRRGWKNLALAAEERPKQGKVLELLVA